MRTTGFVSVLAVPVLASLVWAGPVAPTKPSQIVTLTVFGAPGPCVADEYHVNAMRLADGTSAPFVIPAKQVFVISSVDFFGTNGISGRRYLYRLGIDGAGTILAADAGFADASGRYAGSVTIPTGVVIAPGLALCSGIVHDLGDLPAFARVHGFFTADK